ncbi:MAG: CNP1-like family protein [Ramlibacter sp.]
MRLSSLAWVAALVVSSGHAQLVPADPDWREVEAPPPPAVKLDGLIPIEMPRSGLRFGVDPASVAIGEDGIVRYVMVATSESGAVNAIYEAIRCNTAEFRVYARYNPGSKWTIAKDSLWRPLQDSRHSLVIARTGVCMGRAPNRPVAQILRDLRAPVDTRFEQQR